MLEKVRQNFLKNCLVKVPCHNEGSVRVSVL